MTPPASAHSAVAGRESSRSRPPVATAACGLAAAGATGDRLGQADELGVLIGHWRCCYHRLARWHGHRGHTPVEAAKSCVGDPRSLPRAGLAPGPWAPRTVTRVSAARDRGAGEVPACARPRAAPAASARCKTASSSPTVRAAAAGSGPQEKAMSGRSPVSPRGYPGRNAFSTVVCYEPYSRRNHRASEMARRLSQGPTPGAPPAFRSRRTSVRFLSVGRPDGPVFCLTIKSKPSNLGLKRCQRVLNRRRFP